MECEGQQACEAFAAADCSCSSPSRRGSPSSRSPPKVCCKCKQSLAQVAANQTEVLCAACLNNALFSKFKTAVNMHELILPADKVLLAFSGGPSSRVALEYLLEIREKAQRDSAHYNDSRERVFGFGVVHIDESAAIPLASLNAETLNQELTAIVMGREKRPDEFYIFPIEGVYSEANLDVTGTENNDQANSKERLQHLLKTVTDPTGKEDLLEHIRMQALQQAAKKQGYTRLVLGLSTTRIATKVIAETSKGCGFSLPAGIQYYDGRWRVPVLLPLRDCVAKELVLLCHFRNLKWEDNPSRERTIMRTSAKLQPFSFNRTPSLHFLTSNKKSASTLRSNGSENKDTIVEFLCRLCCAPLNPHESLNSAFYPQLVGAENGLYETELELNAASSPIFWKECCHCCQYQILQQGGLDKTHHLLPPSMRDLDFINEDIRQKWMRSQINDCLLSDCESDDEEAVT